MFLTLLLILVIISNIYVNVNKQKPIGLISLNEYYQNVRQKGKFWELLQIVSVPFIFLYNQAINVLYLLQGAFSLLIWLFSNIFINGIWLIIRLLYHYFILWPWKILLLAFEQIRNSWKLSLYKIGVRGLFFTLLIAFLGRYLVLQFNFTVFLSYAMSLISIFPLAASLAKISALRHAASGTSDEPQYSNEKTTYYTALIILLTIALVGINALLLYIGSFTVAAPAITALVSGGSIFISILLICICIVVFFLLSVFPQHLLHSTGDLKTLIQSALKHLLNKWPQYILGAIASLLPAAILSIIPSLLITGSVYVTNNIAKGIFSGRIAEKNIQIKETTPNGQLADWVDPDKISNDSAMAIIKVFGKQKELELEKEALEINQRFVTSELKKYSNPIGAASIFGVAGAGYVFYSGEQKAVNAKPALTKDDANRSEANLNETQKKDAEALKMLNTTLKNEFEKGKSYVSKLEKELEDVCTIKQTYTSGESTQGDGGAFVSVNSTSDQCEERRKEIRTRIAEQEQKNQYTQEKLTRLTKINFEIDLIHDNLKDSILMSSTMFAIAYLLLGIWICLIVAICCGFWIIVFGNLNYAIYHENKDAEKWHITEVFREANSKNKNQPLFGILAALILPVLLVTFFDSFNFLHKINPSKILKKLFSVEARSSRGEIDNSNRNNKMSASIVYEGPSAENQKNQRQEEDSIVAYYDSTAAAIAASQAGENISGQQGGQETSPVMPQQGITSPDSQTGIDANSYMVIVDKFTTQAEAEQSRISYGALGINLQVIKPGTFLGNYDQYYLVCGGFDINLFNAQRIKNQLNEKGVNCSIQKF